MVKTFDEAINYVKENSYVEYSGEVLDIEDVIKLLEKLKQEYAPTIEMTQEAYNELNDLRSHNRDLEGVLSRAMFSYNPLKWYTTEELAQAWLHPETIKVGDEQWLHIL